MIRSLFSPDPSVSHIQFQDPATAAGMPGIVADRTRSDEIFATRGAELMALWESCTACTDSGLARALILTSATKLLKGPLPKVHRELVGGGLAAGGQAGEPAQSWEDRAIWQSAQEDLIAAVAFLAVDAGPLTREPSASWPAEWRPLWEGDWRSLLLQQMEGAVERLAQQDPPVRGRWLAIQAQGLARVGALGAAGLRLQELLLLPAEQRAGVDLTAVYLACAQGFCLSDTPQNGLPWLHLTHPSASDAGYCFRTVGRHRVVHTLRPEEELAPSDHPLPWSPARDPEPHRQWMEAVRALMNGLSQRLQRGTTQAQVLLETAARLGVGDQQQPILEMLSENPASLLCRLEEAATSMSGLKGERAQAVIHQLQQYVTEQLGRQWRMVETLAQHLEDPCLAVMVLKVQRLAVESLDPARIFRQMQEGEPIRELAQFCAESGWDALAQQEFRLWNAVEQAGQGLCLQRMESSAHPPLEGLLRAAIVQRAQLRSQAKQSSFIAAWTRSVEQFAQCAIDLQSLQERIVPALRPRYLAAWTLFGLRLSNLHLAILHWRGRLHLLSDPSAVEVAAGEQEAFEELRQEVAAVFFSIGSLQGHLHSCGYASPELTQMSRECAALGKSLRQRRALWQQRYGAQRMAGLLIGRSHRLDHCWRRVLLGAALSCFAPLDALELMRGTPSGSSLLASCLGARDPREQQELWVELVRGAVRQQAFVTAGLLLAKASEGCSMWSEACGEFCRQEIAPRGGPLLRRAGSSPLQWPVHSSGVSEEVTREWAHCLRAYVQCNGGLRCFESVEQIGPLALLLEMVRTYIPQQKRPEVWRGCQRFLFASTSWVRLMQGLEVWRLPALAIELQQMARQFDAAAAQIEVAAPSAESLAELSQQQVGALHQAISDLQELVRSG